MDALKNPYVYSIIAALLTAGAALLLATVTDHAASRGQHRALFVKTFLAAIAANLALHTFVLAPEYVSTEPYVLETQPAAAATIQPAT